MDFGSELIDSCYFSVVEFSLSLLRLKHCDFEKGFGVNFFWLIFLGVKRAQQATNRGRLKRNIGLGQRSAIFRQEATGISLSQGSNFCLTCKRTQPGIRRSLPSAFQDRTSFSLSKSRFNSSLVRKLFPSVF